MRPARPLGGACAAWGIVAFGVWVVGCGARGVGCGEQCCAACGAARWSLGQLIGHPAGGRGSRTGPPYATPPHPASGPQRPKPGRTEALASLACEPTSLSARQPASPPADQPQAQQPGGPPAHHWRSFHGILQQMALEARPHTTRSPTRLPAWSPAVLPQVHSESDALPALTDRSRPTDRSLGQPPARPLARPTPCLAPRAHTPTDGAIGGAIDRPWRRTC